MSEKFKGDMSDGAMEFSDIKEATKTLGRDVEAFKHSEQPLPQEAETAYEALLAAADNAGKLDALKRMAKALEGYDPVGKEVAVKDVKATVGRMIFEFEKTGA